MLKPKSAQGSFFGSYLYDRIVPVDHLLRQINQVVDFSFVRQILEDRYHPDLGRPAEDPEFPTDRWWRMPASIWLTSIFWV